MNFFHNSVKVLGIEAIQPILDVTTLCTNNLEFVRLFDVFAIINHCIDTFKTNSLKILEPCYRTLLTKACQTPIAKTEISEEERQVIRMHERMLILMQLCLEIIGPEFVFNQEIAPLIEPSLDFLMQYYLQGVTKSSKKVILKIVKYILMILKGVSTASENSAKLA